MLKNRGIIIFFIYPVVLIFFIVTIFFFSFFFILVSIFIIPVMLLFRKGIANLVLKKNFRYNEKSVDNDKIIDAEFKKHDSTD